MSQAASFADFRAALTTPGVRTPVLMSLLARMPIAMVGIALLFYVQRETNSFTIAGFVSAGSLVGVATGAVVQGRIMDRLGPTRPMLVTTALFVVAVVAEIGAIETARPAAVMVALGALVGFTEPLIGSASRALWAHLVPAGPIRHAAFAYEAISLEVFFVLGPALAGIMVAAPWAGTGLVFSAACMTVGAIGFALTRVVQDVRPEATNRTLLGALASPGMRTVALAALGFGVTIGFVEVAMPAAATKAGHAPLGGVMLAAWSLISVIFGVYYTGHPWPRRTSLRLPFLLGIFALLIAPLALVASNLLVLALLSMLAGMWITPQATTHSTTLDLVAPPGTTTEAFGWVITSVTLGLAAGQSISGYLVEQVGVWSSFLASSVAGLLIAALVWRRRHTVSSTSGKFALSRGLLAPG